LEKIHSFLPTTSDTKKYLELVKENAIVKEWVELCRNQIVRGSRIIGAGIICSPMEYLLVEIGTLGMYPSTSATMELNSFFNHTARHIEEQLKQLQPKSPNIIIVQGDNWMLFGLGYELLYERVQRFLENKKEKSRDLSGVAFFRRKIERAVYINNPYTSESSRLNMEDIDKLGFRWFGPGYAYS